MIPLKTIPLEAIHIAKPCPADWEAMDGDAQVRHCGQCRKNVYNLSEMTRAQAEALVTEHEGHLCVRYFARADGTVMTQDCPVGLHAFRVKLVRKFSCAAALILSCLAGLGRGDTARAVTTGSKAAGHKAAGHATMGKPAVPKPIHPGWTAGAPRFVPPKPARPKPTLGRVFAQPPALGGVVSIRPHAHLAVPPPTKPPR